MLEEARVKASDEEKSRLSQKDRKKGIEINSKFIEDMGRVYVWPPDGYRSTY